MVNQIEPFLDMLMGKLIQFGYALIVAVIILMAGWVTGRLVSRGVEGFMSKLGAEAVFRKVALGRALIRSGYTAAGFSSSIAKWIIYIVAIHLSLKSLRVPEINVYADGFISYLPTLVGSFLILIIGLILSDWLGEFVKSSFLQEEREAFYINPIGDGLKVVLYYVTITLALSKLGVDVTILYIFAQAFAWSLAIAIGIAAGIALGWVLKDKIKDWLALKETNEH